MSQLILIAILIVCGYFFGRHAEKQHFRRIETAEKSLINLPCTNTKFPLQSQKSVHQVKLATGNVVISVDYFKRILSTLQQLVGGRVSAYETLVDRAKREAIIRLKQSCISADEIINLRIETSSISQGGRNQIGSVEVLAFGTAIYYQKVSDQV